MRCGAGRGGAGRGGDVSESDYLGSSRAGNETLRQWLADFEVLHMFLLPSREMHFLVFKLETYLGGPAFVHALRCATDAVRTMVGATTTKSGQNDIRVSTYDPPAPSMFNVY